MPLPSPAKTAQYLRADPGAVTLCRVMIQESSRKEYWRDVLAVLLSSCRKDTEVVDSGQYTLTS